MKPDIAAAWANAGVRSRHPRYDFRTQEGRDSVAYIGEHLAPYLKPGMRAVELGCAAGKTTFALAELGPTMWGIDCAEATLEYAREIAADIGSDATFVHGDYTRTAFDDGFFDAAVFPNNIVECSYDEVETLSAEVARILAPGGLFLLLMKDGAIMLKQRPQQYDTYVVETGQKRGRIRNPCGEFDYPCWLWTVGFARHAVGRYLRWRETKEIGDNHYLLVFAVP